MVGFYDGGGGGGGSGGDGGERVSRQKVEVNVFDKDRVDKLMREKKKRKKGEKKVIIFLMLRNAIP